MEEEDSGDEASEEEVRAIPSVRQDLKLELRSWKGATSQDIPAAFAHEKGLPLTASEAMRASVLPLSRAEFGQCSGTSTHS